MPSFPLVASPTPTTAIGTDLALTLSPDVDNPVEGDLNLRNGQLYLVADLASQVQQGITIRARFFYGEWFLDTTQGMLWFEKVFIKSPSRAVLTSMFRQLLLSVPGVASIRTLSFTPIAAIRNMRVDFEIILTDGVILPGAFTPFTLKDIQ